MRSKAWLALAVCMLAALACNVTALDEDDSGTPQTGQLVDDFSGPPPTVQILAPASGQQAVIGDDVEIRVVATDQRGVDRLQLAVGGRTSSSKAFPEAATTAEALLRWRPDPPTAALSGRCNPGSTTVRKPPRQSRNPRARIGGIDA
jgi:hypothetical protein